jgi:hypothetical protein
MVRAKGKGGREVIEINCHMCGESYAAHITLGRAETRHQPAEPDTVEPEECPACGADTDKGAAVEAFVDRVAHEREVKADGERKRENE